MKRLVSVLGAVATLTIAGASGAAFAQNAAQEQTNPVKIALAHQLIEQNGGQQAVKAQMDAMFEIIKRNIGKSLPDNGDAIVNEIYNEIERDVDSIIPQLIDISAKAYARNYTEKEMRDMLVFEQSDTGRSMRLKAPAVRSEAMNEMMPVILKLMPEMMRHTADHVCDVSHCNAQQRETVAAAVSKALQPAPQ